MNDSFQFIDIIFFAMIAAFLVLRLRGVLGRRDGHEGRVHNPYEEAKKDENKKDLVDDNVIPISDEFLQEAAEEEVKVTSEEAAVEKQDAVDELLSKGFKDIRAIDPTFNKEEFISGANVAFEIILSAYAEGDTKALEPLLNADVYTNFLQAIKDREQDGKTMEDTLVGISVSEIVEAFVEGVTENITVKFVSEQINVIKDSNGEVVEGDPNTVIETIDFWTFSRNAQSKDPNWTLVATNSLD